MSNTIKNNVIEEVKSFFEASHYKYSYSEDSCMFDIGFNLKSSIRSTNIYIFVDEYFLISFATVPFRISKNLNQVYEYIGRVNFGLLNGNFEVDPNDGEIRYKTYIHFGDSVPTQSAINASLSVSVNMLNRYLNGLVDVMEGVVTPEAAVQAAQSTTAE